MSITVQLVQYDSVGQPQIIQNISTNQDNIDLAKGGDSSGSVGVALGNPTSTATSSVPVGLSTVSVLDTSTTGLVSNASVPVRLPSQGNVHVVSVVDRQSPIYTPVQEFVRDEESERTEVVVPEQQEKVKKSGGNGLKKNGKKRKSKGSWIHGTGVMLTKEEYENGTTSEEPVRELTKEEIKELARKKWES
jgi:hypothetical protein